MPGTVRLDLVSRIQLLESQNRRLRRIGAGCVLIGVAALLMGQAPANKGAKVVEASRFVVRDKDGKVRLSMGAEWDGKTAVRFSDSAGRERLVLFLDEKGTPGVRFRGEDGKDRLLLLGKKAGGSVALCEEGGAPRARMAVSAVGAGFELWEKPLKLRAALLVTGGYPALVLRDENQARLVASLTKEGAAVVEFRDAAGETHWRAPPHADDDE